jgi:NADH-quinone oxidoreductase subunit L
MLALIPLLPFVGFLVNSLVGRRLSKSVSGGVACLAMFASFLVGAASVWSLVGRPVGDRVVEQVLFQWITSGDFDLPLMLRLDPLGAVMVLVVTGIAFVIHVYSTAYMHEETDGEYARYFAYLNLFAAFMLVLVLGANFLVMFVGWEGVGLCSYLLIGFWFKKKSASDAGKKAFIVNRIGDFAFVVGMLLLFREFGTLDFLAVAQRAATLSPETTFGLVSLMTLLFFVGATGKSAQIPLYTWLPDAMEGPTPVSALIHAATMVTAGVYMIGRNAELFSLAPQTLQVVAVIGACTALMAGTIGLVQNDIKRVLAYSTVSQLGYMFLAMGVGAFSAGIFHLYTHAFFKALMFLGSGAVIHALHGEQDMRHMGGLKRELPITYWTFLVGALAIAGVPLLSGFFSKDEILFYTFYRGHTVLWVLGALTALLTATYMFRLVYMTFFGERRNVPAARDPGDGHGHGSHAHGDHGHAGHLHDAPPAMATALVVLAVGAVLAGYIGVPHFLGGSNRIETFLEPSFHPAAFATTQPGPQGAVETHGEAGEHDTARGADHATPAAHGESHDDPGKVQLEWSLMAVSVALAFAGIGLATLFFKAQPERAERMAAAFPGVHRLLLNKYYVDEVYDAAIVQPMKATSEKFLWKTVDAGVIDGLVNGTGAVVRGSASVLRLFQTGSVRAYAASLFIGGLFVVAYFLVR